MTATPAQIAANRLNSMKSKGPSEEAKARTRANALKHGLCAMVLIPEDAAALQERAESIYKAFKPYTDYQAWNVNRAAVITLRVERCEAMERRVREKTCLRAELTWDDDRRLEAEVLGGMLSKKPAETVAALRRTPHGCDWLMSRWALLAHAADNQNGNWTDEQTVLAFDLLSTPAIFRVGHKPGAWIDFKGKIIDPADDSAAVARRMVDELMERREVVADLDEVDRVLAAADLDHEKSSELRRLRRYETALHNRLRWTVKQMQFQGPSGRPDPGYFPQFTVEAPPEEKPEPKHRDELLAEAHDPTSPHPPFCLTPDEYPPIDKKADIPAILESRKKKRLKKAESRRESARRKAEKLRA